jgi:hypothetical protein
MELYFAGQGAGRVAGPVLAGTARFAIAAAGASLVVFRHGSLVHAFDFVTVAAFAFAIISAQSFRVSSWTSARTRPTSRPTHRSSPTHRASWVLLCGLLVGLGARADNVQSTRPRWIIVVTISDRNTGELLAQKELGGSDSEFDDPDECKAVVALAGPIRTPEGVVAVLTCRKVIRI